MPSISLSLYQRTTRKKNFSRPFVDSFIYWIALCVCFSSGGEEGRLAADNAMATRANISVLVSKIYTTGGGDGGENHRRRPDATRKPRGRCWIRQEVLLQIRHTRTECGGEGTAVASGQYGMCVRVRTRCLWSLWPSAHILCAHTSAVHLV